MCKGLCLENKKKNAKKDTKWKKEIFITAKKTEAVKNVSLFIQKKDI